jgi:hypothetical protein
MLKNQASCEGAMISPRNPMECGPGWHHHIALSLLAVWFWITETHRGQSLTPALTLP